MSVRILIGDCRDRLKELPDESVHCVVTSPPYWGLRDYGVVGQMGMEATYGEHVADISELFDEVRRVLKSDGTLWLNYGDSYATSVNGRSAADTKAAGNDDRTFRDKPFSTIQGVLKPKDLCGIPWRVAFALQADGWWLRQDIIWSKPNPMPESVTDRCTKAHEYLFLLSKSERYYFDQDAISEPIDYPDNRVPHDRLRTRRTINNHVSKSGNKAKSWGNNETDVRRDGSGDVETQRGIPWEGSLRNKRSVWTIGTQPFSEAHFATFPPALIEPCILAGCPEGGTVLDPFGGAGTTGLVADRLKRNAILIELSPAYAEMAERRIHGDGPLFSDVTVRAATA